MNFMTGLMIYACIGIIWGMYEITKTKREMNGYKEESEKLSRLRNEAETFEEKAKYRNEILKLDEKYDFIISSENFLKLFTEEALYNTVFLAIAIGWPIKAIFKIRKLIAK